MVRLVYIAIFFIASLQIQETINKTPLTFQNTPIRNVNKQYAPRFFQNCKSSIGVNEGEIRRKHVVETEQFHWYIFETLARLDFLRSVD